MSTPSATPLTPRGPRNNRRNQKKTTTPSAQNASTLATPPSSPPGAVSPREAPTDSSGTIPLSKKKGNRSAKKPRDGTRTSPTSTGKPNHRHTSSHPSNNITTPHMKDTHYAGPTFHASPAPSALPIPSFFSKSFPESDLAPTLEQDSDCFEADGDIENTPSKPKSRPFVPQQEERESTPLDFLFKAAVEARKSQSLQSPEPSPRARSPQTDSKAIPHRKYNNDTTRMFPMEMEAPDMYQSEIGPSFAPSYRDRMNALRSASSPSPALQDLDEDQRKAKTEALKTLLLNPRPQRPSSISQASHDQFNQKHDRPVLSPMVPPHFATPMRTSSGPPVMKFQWDPPGRNTSQFPYAPRRESHHTHFSSPQRHQAQDPTWGNGVLSSNPGNAPHTPRQAYGSPSRDFSPSKFVGSHQSPNYHSQITYKSPVSQKLPPVDTKKMEDDLRRILKLDVNTSIPPGGIQSSLA
ncbi:uncharacterized protein BDV17DRAFT_162679 [Aspergillus undulatus]|uniref:uncharacterized protein n=1 Tax=Aspergillus undulatus TaxID=1810928 RepID=UPI003CCD7F91